MLRNPVYRGMIVVPAFENDTAFLAKGLHEPLVSDSLFADVQKVLGRVRLKNIHLDNSPNDMLLFRGFLNCPQCGRRLTGSASKGKKGKYYYYYHCNGRCRFRTRADAINAHFMLEIGKLNVVSEYIEIYRDILRHIRRDIYDSSTSSEKSISAAIDKLIERIVRAKVLLIKGDIDDEDYKLLKKDSEAKIHLLGTDLQRSEIASRTKSDSLKKATFQLSQFGKTFTALSTSERRTLMEILLSPSITLNEGLSINDMINADMGLLFDLDSLSQSRLPERCITYTESMDQAFYEQTQSRIQETLLTRKGQAESRQTALVLDFLIIFAKMFSKNHS